MPFIRNNENIPISNTMCKENDKNVYTCVNCDKRGCYDINCTTASIDVFNIDKHNSSRQSNYDMDENLSSMTSYSDMVPSAVVTAASTTTTPSPVVVMEFENLPKHVVHHHQHRQERMNTRTVSSSSSSFCSNDDDDDWSLTTSTFCSTASSSLLAANDKNMTRAEFHNLPKETRDILKTIQMINDDDDFSLDSEAAEEILNHLEHTMQSNPRYYHHPYTTNEEDNKYYHYANNTITPQK